MQSCFVNYKNLDNFKNRQEERKTERTQEGKQIREKRGLEL